jgi:hypothetical protein
MFSSSPDGMVLNCAYDLDLQGTANEWDDKAIEIYASLAAVGVTDNNSCNCLACKV